MVCISFDYYKYNREWLCHLLPKEVNLHHLVRTNRIPPPIVCSLTIDYAGSLQYINIIESSLKKVNKRQSDLLFTYLVSNFLLPTHQQIGPSLFLLLVLCWSLKNVLRPLQLLNHLLLNITLIS